MSVQFPIAVHVKGDKSAHELFLTKSSTSYVDLQKIVMDLIKGSANCDKWLAGMQKDDAKAVLTATQIVARWSSVGRDDNFPKSTALSASNTQAVLRMMELGGGKDTLEVEVGVAEPKKKDDKDVNKEPKESQESK